MSDTMGGAPTEPVAMQFDPDFPMQEIEQPPEEPVRPAPTLRGVAIVGVRFIIGAVTLAVLGVVVVAASVIPIPIVRSSVPSVEVNPAAAEVQRVCAGPVLRLGTATGEQANTATTVGTPAVTIGSSQPVTATSVATTDAKTDGVPAGGTSAAPSFMTIAPSTKSQLLAAAQSQVVNSDEQVGLAASVCERPSSSAWLVGGSTLVGRTTLITLTNVSDVESTVALDIYGEHGLVQAPGTAGITVAPHSQRIFSLAGFAPGISSPVVHVISRGGPVVAHLQQSIVRGLDPGGVDVIGKAADPSRQSVIPGVTVSGIQTVQGEAGEQDYSDVQSVLRVFVPGSTVVDARIELVPEGQSGAGTGATFSVQLQPTVVTDLALDDLVDGSYTVRLTTSAPVVAAARISTAAASDTAITNDFGWFVSASELADSTMVSVAAGPSPVLHLENPTTSSAHVMLTSSAGASGGAEITVIVPGGGVASVPVNANASYTVSGFARLYAAVSYSADGELGAYTVVPNDVAVPNVRVWP